MFADDTKIYMSITREEDHLALQRAVSDVADWLERNACVLDMTLLIA